MCFTYNPNNDFTGAWVGAVNGIEYANLHLVCPGSSTNPYAGLDSTDLTMVYKLQRNGDLIATVAGPPNQFCVDLTRDSMGGAGQRDFSVDFCDSTCTEAECEALSGLADDANSGRCTGGGADCGDGAGNCDYMATSDFDDTCYLGRIVLHSSCSTPLSRPDSLGPLTLSGACGGSCVDATAEGGPFVGERVTYADCGDYAVPVYS